MLGYILRRLIATLPVMLIVAVLVFLMLRLTPGDPAAIIAGDNANNEQIALIRNRLGLDEPIFTQFFIWIANILHGVNSSNGCTNLLPADAQRLYNFLEIGDVVDYPNANGKPMQIGDGYGDWNVNWGIWRTGGLVSTTA